MERSNSKANIVEEEVLQVIADNYDNIFSAEKKVADYVLANPNQTVELNVSELAKASGVSDATVVRMCHHIGYSGYYQFRITLARDLGKRWQEESVVTDHKDAVARLFASYAEAIAAVGRRIDEKAIRECANLLKNADMVHIIAAGNSSNISRYMGFRLERMGIKSVYDDLPEYYINHINLSKKGEVLVAISKSGISKSVVRGMELAKERGLRSIAITASAQSPVSKLADYLLISSGKQEPFIIEKSYVYMNEFAVAEALLDFVAKKDLSKTSKGDRPEIVLSDFKL